MACLHFALLRELVKFLFLTFFLEIITAQRCQPDWPTVLTIQFVNYSNPTDQKATNQLCDRHDPNAGSTDFCDLLFSVCVSDIGKRDCRYYELETGVLTEGTQITFGPKFGSEDNPFNIYINSGTWQGVSIQVTVFDQDNRMSIPLDHVDEFVIDYKSTRDGVVRTFAEDGKRMVNPSRFVLRVYSDCVEVQTPSTTTKETTRPVITTKPLCSEGSPTQLIINFLNFSNPSNKKALGHQCEENDRVVEGSPLCDLMFDICMSRIGSRNCEYLSMLSPVLAEGTAVHFTQIQTPNWRNPARITLDNQWKGVHIKVKVSDRDGGERFTLDAVDEFNFDYYQLDSYRVKKAVGERAVEPTELFLGLSVDCPGNLIATTRTTMPTFTVPTRATSTTVSPPRCDSDSAKMLNLQFVSYENPSDEKATNQLCDRDDPNAAANDFCDLLFSVCISDIGKRDCKHYELETGVLKEGTSIVFGNTFGTQPNPFTVYLGPSAQQGVNIHVTVFDQDNKMMIPLDHVDEFEFDYTYIDGVSRRYIELGKRVVRPSRLDLNVASYCIPQSSTPATTSTTRPTTPTTTTQTSTTQSTTTTPSLPLCTDSAPTEIIINFLNYTNPSNRKALGQQCEENDRVTEGTPLCDLQFDVCLSRIGSRNCEYLTLLSPMLAEGTAVHFTKMQTSTWTNPIRVRIDGQWKGVHVTVKVLDRDGGEKYTLDAVDEFGFDYTEEKQNQELVMRHTGSRLIDPTELYLGINAACPGNYRYRGDRGRLLLCDVGYQDQTVCSLVPCESSLVITTFCRVKCGLCRPQ